MRIRSRLFLVALSIVVPAWLAAACSVWFVYTEQKESYAQGMAEAVRALALLVDNELHVTESVLLTLARSPALRKGDLDTFRQYAREVVPETDRVVVLSRLDGQQLVNTRAMPGRELPRVSSAVFSLSRLTPDRTVVSDFFVGPVAKRKDVAVDVPVRIDGQVRYRMAMGFEAAALEKLLQGRRATNWLMTVFDRNGIVLARSVGSEQFVGRPANPVLLERIQAREQSGIVNGASLDGTPVTAFFHRAPFSSWTAVISVPNAELQQPARRAALMLAVLVLGLLGLGVVVAHWYARKTAAPVESLRAAAQQLGDGHVVRVERSGLTEVDLVGAALSRASEQVQQHQTILEQRVREAVAAAEQSHRALLQAQRLEGLGRLTGGIAHDFNNILQTLTSALQLMSRTSDLALVRRLSETSQRAVSKGAALMAQLRAFGRVQDVRLETLQLPAALANCLPLLTNALPANVSLHTDAPEALWPVTIDRLQFELALLNIVINARDAMPQGGQIRVTLSKLEPGTLPASLAPGRYVGVQVRDNGRGIPPEVLAHAIDPFYTTKSPDSGSGLGLAQAYGFATQAGGTLALDSEVGKGTTVTICLPAARLAVEALPAPLAPVASAMQERGAGTVLFVEDDALVRDSVAPALREAGFTVLEAHDADHALQLLASGERIDALFSDVVMPGRLSGVDLARQVRAQFPDLPILLASGHTDLAISLERVKLVGKPYAVDKVVGLLAQAMSARADAG